MNKKIVSLVVVFAGAALAAAAEATANAAAPASGNIFQAVNFLVASVLASGIGVGIAAGACGVGMGICIASALQGIARQPELTAKLQLNMMIGLAFIESLVLYTLFIAIILLFANPFMKYFV